jgi:hypothetical protein
MFRGALTKLAVKGGKIPILGAADIPAFNMVKDLLADKDPYRYCINNFFLMFEDETSRQWGNFKRQVSFFFDQNKSEWEMAVREIFNMHQKNDSRIATLDFGDKKDPMLAPLQAADLLAHRYRQLAEDFGRTGKFPSQEPLDAVLFKNLLESRERRGSQRQASGVTSKHSTFESKSNSNVECLDVIPIRMTPTSRTATSGKASLTRKCRTLR